MGHVYEKGEFVEMIDLATFGPLAVPIPARWYVLRVHPGREAKVMRAFRQRNISAYLPMITKAKEITQRRHGFERTIRRNVSLPLFPGLCFIPDFECKVDIHRKTSRAACPRALAVDGVAGFLEFDDWTAQLSRELICDVRAIEAYGNVPASARERMFRTGQLVRVTAGPLARFSGRIDRLDSNGRLSVMVDLFKRLVAVAVTEDQIEAV